MADISKDAVEAIAAEFDKRVEMHAQLASGPCGEVRTARGDETAKTHSTTAAMLRALSARVEELTAQNANLQAGWDGCRKQGMKAEQRGRLQGLDEAAAATRRISRECRAYADHPPSSPEAAEWKAQRMREAYQLSRAENAIKALKEQQS